MIETTLIIVCIVCIGLFAWARDYYETKLILERRKISFKESMDLLNLPIVTFSIGENKLNFLLDTGSDYSYIATSYIPLLGKVKAEESGKEILGSGGIVTSSSQYTVELKYKEYVFMTTLLANPGIDQAFKDLKKDSGIQVHGIIGSRFLSKHNYVLDFAELIAYQKNKTSKNENSKA